MWLAINQLEILISQQIAKMNSAEGSIPVPSDEITFWGTNMNIVSVEDCFLLLIDRLFLLLDQNLFLR